MNSLGLNKFKIASLVAVALLWLYFSPETAILWSIFIIWLAFKIDERILGGIAILFLIFIPILLSLEHVARAEKLATYVFFLMCMIVALQTIELIRNPETNETTTPDIARKISSRITTTTKKVRRSVDGIIRKSTRKDI